MNRLEVLAIDRVGLVSAISGIISRSCVNIISHSATVFNDISGSAMSRFTAEIDLGNVQSEKLITSLNKIKGIVRAEIK